MSPRLHLHFRRRPPLWSWWLEADINWTMCCNASFLNYVTTLELFFHGNIQLCHAVQHVLMRRVALFVGNSDPAPLKRKTLIGKFRCLLSCNLCLIWFYCVVFGKHNMAIDHKLFEHVGIWQLIESFHFEKPHMMENLLLGMRSVSKWTSFCHYELSPCTALADHVQSFIQVRLRSAYAHIVRVECIFTNWCGAQGHGFSPPWHQ